MGKYINNTEKRGLKAPFIDKLAGLIEDGAELIADPVEWEEGLVCLIDNGYMSAAGYAYDKGEMDHFLSGMGERPYNWLKWNKAKEYAK